MLIRTMPLLAVALGCQAPRVDISRAVEAHGPTIVPIRATHDIVPCAASDSTVHNQPLDLRALWGLTLANNPSLVEAAADVEAARGRRAQAGMYPNPRFVYVQDVIGSRVARQGNFALQLNQEIVTAGKRRLDQAVAQRETSVV